MKIRVLKSSGQLGFRPIGMIMDVEKNLGYSFIRLKIAELANKPKKKAAKKADK